MVGSIERSELRVGLRDGLRAGDVEVAVAVAVVQATNVDVAETEVALFPDIASLSFFAFFSSSMTRASLRVSPFSRASFVLFLSFPYFA
jgi:hypothetical protein